jgi:hypothetical protein
MNETHNKDWGEHTTPLRSSTAFGLATESANAFYIGYKYINKRKKRQEHEIVRTMRPGSGLNPPFCSNAFAYDGEKDKIKVFW